MAAPGKIDGQLRRFFAMISAKKAEMRGETRKSISLSGGRTSD